MKMSALMRIKTMRTGMWTIAVALLCHARTAHAGEWVVDRYETTATAMSQEGNWSAYGEEAQTRVHTVNGKEEPGAPGSSEYGSLTHTAVSAHPGYTNWPNDPAQPGAPKLMGFSRGSIKAIFKWQRNQIYDAQNGPGSGHDDPDDNPPAIIWIRESASISAGKTKHHNNNADPLWTGGYIVIEGKDSLGNSAGTPNGGRSHQDIGIFDSWSGTSATARVRAYPAGTDTVVGPTFSFHGKITMFGGYISAGGDQYTDLYFNYGATLATLNISLKRKDSDLPEVSGDGYNSAAIAAGAKDTLKNEHWAEVFVTLDPPLAGQELKIAPETLPSPPADSNGNSSTDDRVFDPQFPVLWKPNPHPITDENGKAKIGEWRSDDIFTGGTGRLVVPGRPRTAPNRAFASLHQAWDEDGQAEGGPGAHWNYGKEFDYDTDIPVTFQPSFTDSYDYGAWSSQPTEKRTIKITKHTMNFLVGRIRVSGIDPGDPNSGRKTWFFTSERRKVDPPFYTGPPILYATQEELDALASCSPRQVTDVSESGIYQTTLRMTEPEADEDGEVVLKFGEVTVREASIEQVWLKAQDDGVWGDN